MSVEPASARYEVLFDRLQEIVSKLEAGDLPLEESLAFYEEGVAIAAACQQLLDDATLKVQQLQIGMPQSE